MIAAIDPGASGAIAILADSGEILAHCMMPTIKSGKTTRVNAAALAGFLREFDDVKACFIERVGAMPGGGERRMGASSAFNFGHSAGVVEGVIAALGVPLHLIAPQAWKKSHGLIGKDKDEARTIAARLYPMERTFDLKGKGQALADAVLLGLHGLKRGASNVDL